MRRLGALDRAGRAGPPSRYGVAAPPRGRCPWSPVRSSSRQSSPDRASRIRRGSPPIPSSGLPGAPRPAGLAGDVHALGRAVAVASTEPRWREEVLLRLRPVRQGFAEHVRVTEGPAGLYRELLTQSPRLDHGVRLLTREHVAIVAAILARPADRRAARDAPRRAAAPGRAPAAEAGPASAARRRPALGGVPDGSGRRDLSLGREPAGRRTASNRTCVGLPCCSYSRCCSRRAVPRPAPVRPAARPARRARRGVRPAGRSRSPRRGGPAPTGARVRAVGGADSAHR